MNIICEKSNLLDGINISSRAVSARSTLSILQCLLLVVEEGEFKCIGNDLELGIQTKIEAQIIEDGKVAIDSRMFTDIVRKLPDSEVTIRVDKNNLITISCENSEFNIVGQDPTEFIFLPEVVKDKYAVLNQALLKKKIQQTIFSVSLDNIRVEITGELFEIENNILTIVSIDGYRISIQKMPMYNEIEDTSVIIPAKTLTEIQKILSSEEDEVYIYFTDKHVLFEMDKTTIVSRIIEGNFLEYKSMFSDDYNNKVLVNREKLLRSIERAALIAREGRKSPIKLDIGNKKISITSATERGNVHEEVDVIGQGDDLIIGFNPRYLIEALRVIEDDEVTITFTNPLSPCIIKNDENDDYSYLILSLRLE